MIKIKIKLKSFQIQHCHPTQVRHMMTIIEPQFQRDFISLLPKEVKIKFDLRKKEKCF